MREFRARVDTSQRRRETAVDILNSKASHSAQQTLCSTDLLFSLFLSKYFKYLRIWSLQIKQPKNGYGKNRI